MISLAPADFFWATGIEDTFIPQVRPGLRSLDEYDLTQHYQLWKTDFDLAADAGIRYLRWGLPWYRIQPGPDQWNWRWADEALDYMVNVRGITPILDLMHYGTPLWLENSFLNAGYAERVAEYACRTLERYRGLIRYVTPLNEPSVNADMCGRRGQWPPYLQGEDGFVKILTSIARGIVQTVQTLRAVQPDLQMVQVEALWHNWTTDPSPEIQRRVAEGNLRQYLCFDLTTGRVRSGDPLYTYLRAHGIHDAELAWFQENQVAYDVLGANFYPWSYGEVVQRKNGRFRRLRRTTSGFAIAEVIGKAAARYELPMMVTETSAVGNLARRGRWMEETVAAVRRMRAEGVPIVGYTWFPMFTMFDWKYRTGRRPLRDYLLHLGLYEADYDAEGVLLRRATPLVEQYQFHMAQPVPEVGSRVKELEA